MSRGRTPLPRTWLKRLYVEDGATLKAIGTAFGKTRTWSGWGCSTPDDQYR